MLLSYPRARHARVKSDYVFGDALIPLGGQADVPYETARAILERDGDVIFKVDGPGAAQTPYDASQAAAVPVPTPAGLDATEVPLPAAEAQPAAAGGKAPVKKPGKTPAYAAKDLSLEE